MIMTLLVEFLKTNAIKIGAGAIILLVLGGIYYSWQSSICDSCTAKEAKKWQKVRDEEQLKSMELVKLSRYEAEAAAEKQMSVLKRIITDYAIQNQKLSNDNAAYANKRLFIRTLPAEGCGNSGKTPSQIPKGFDERSSGVIWAELDGTTAKYIRDLRSTLARKESMYNNMLVFIKDNGLVEE